MRREVPVERVLFAVLLGVSLLLLSVAMLRSDMAAPSTSTRTFRDGFIVADRVGRRTETASPGEILASTNKSAAANVPVMFRRDATDVPKSGAAPAPAAAAAAAIHVSGADAHTTTIKMEDGDEITIKRAASSKNKITTISTHEDGKITIENRDNAADASAPAPAAASAGTTAAAKTPSPAPLSMSPSIARGDSDKLAAATNADLVEAAAVLDTNASASKKRSVDFVGAYDNDKEPDELTGVGVDVGGDDSKDQLVLNDDIVGGDNTHEIVVGQKKVTVVSVGRSQTTVSLSDVTVAPTTNLETSSR